MSTITPQVLLKAYTAGIFPMAESANDSALYWVEPEVRGIIPLDRFHISRSLARRIRSRRFSVTVDTDFDGVIKACSGQAGSAGEHGVVERPSTWINARISALYNQLHAMGCCHSVECRDSEGALIGGLYGVRIGAVFFGESMFSAQRDASKVAMVHLVARLKAGGFRLLDTQFVTDHLKTFGCEEVPRDDYRKLLDDALLAQADFTAFSEDDNPEAVLASAKSGHHEDT
jgi:leucyl/phenylalanyl-tRNA--protein transferase